MMSDTENFFSRWSRLKRDAEVVPSEVAPSEDMPRDPPFDPATLPPIDSIIADSDIRQFLQVGVPPELTRAALRSAWAADPAIRDFIGIAESQWDFNDHAAMPGFGPVKASDYFKAQITQKLNRVSHEIAETPNASAHTAQRGSGPLPGPDPGPGPQITKPIDEIPYMTAPSIPKAPRTHGGALPK
jgi:hypothetical protein